MRIEGIPRHAAKAVPQSLVGEHLGHTGQHLCHTIGAESAVVVLQLFHSLTGSVGIEEEWLPRYDEADSGRGRVLTEGLLETELADVTPWSHSVANDVNCDLDGRGLRGGDGR